MNDRDEATTRRISDAIEELLPDGVGAFITPQRLQSVMEQLAHYVQHYTANNVLMSLLTVNDVADMLGVSVRRAKALARDRHDRFGVGWRVPGTGQWLFRPEEIESLRPDTRYRRK